jgi:hypothetical protein
MAMGTPERFKGHVDLALVACSGHGQLKKASSVPMVAYLLLLLLLLLLQGS